MSDAPPYYGFPANQRDKSPGTPIRGRFPHVWFFARWHRHHCGALNARIQLPADLFIIDEPSRLQGVSTDGCGYCVGRAPMPDSREPNSRN